MPYDFVKFRKSICENYQYDMVSAIYEEPHCFIFYTREQVVSLGKTTIVKEWTWDKINKEIKCTVLD